MKISYQQFKILQKKLHGTHADKPMQFSEFTKTDGRDSWSSPGAVHCSSQYY